MAVSRLNPSCQFQTQSYLNFLKELYVQLYSKLFIMCQKIVPFSAIYHTTSQELIELL